MDSEGVPEFVDPFGVDGDGGADGGAGGGGDEDVMVLRAGVREAAVRVGRLLGEDEARSRGEIGGLRARRVARAQAYAAWEFDTRAERKRKPNSQEGAVT